MKTAIAIHDENSLRLHWQIFRTLAQLPYTSPGTRARCLQLSDNYLKWADEIRATDGGKIMQCNATSQADLPSLDDIEHMVDWSQINKEPCHWVLQLLDTDMQPIKGKRLAATTLFDFYKAIDKHYPDAPRGIIAWAAYAKIGDGAAYYKTGDKIIYQVTVEV